LKYYDFAQQKGIGMIAVVVFLAAGIFAIVGFVAWLLGRRLLEEREDAEKNIENLLPSHTQHLPQLRQSLDLADRRYIRQKASKEIARKWRADRQKILRSFLSGVAQDFVRLERLASVVGCLSPDVPKNEEIRRAWLRFRFRISYRVLSMEIAAGRPCSMERLARLTELVGNLSANAENAMERLETDPATRGSVDSPLNS
jgi:hypothetical protein